MRERHGVGVTEAGEAIADPDAVLFHPDPKSRSGSSARLLGFSPTRGRVPVGDPGRTSGSPGRVVGCEWLGG